MPLGARYMGLSGGQKLSRNYRRAGRKWLRQRADGGAAAYSRRLALEPGQRDALDEVALEEEEHHQAGQHHHGRVGHEQLPVGVVLCSEGDQPEGQRPLVAALQVDERGR